MVLVQVPCVFAVVLSLGNVGEVMGMITISVDPSRTRSAWAVLTPLHAGPPTGCWVRTGACAVPAGVSGLLAIAEAVDELAGGLVEILQTSSVDIVIENQHIRFASAAMAVIEVRTMWAVVLYQKFGVYPELVQPSSWRVTFDLNRKDIDKKEGARRVVTALPELLFAPRKKPMTEDEWTTWGDAQVA